jgi:hypothetical protein
MYSTCHSLSRLKAMLIKRMHFWLSLVKSTKLRKLLIKEYPGIKYSTWSNGKDILILLGLVHEDNVYMHIWEL